MATNRGFFEAQTPNNLTKADLERFVEAQRWLESKKDSTLIVVTLEFLYNEKCLYSSQESLTEGT